MKKRDKDILRCYLRGEKVDDIADEFKLSQNTIKVILREILTSINKNSSHFSKKPISQIRGMLKHKDIILNEFDRVNAELSIRWGSLAPSVVKILENNTTIKSLQELSKEIDSGHLTNKGFKGKKIRGFGERMLFLCKSAASGIK